MQNTEVQLFRELFDLMPQLGWTALPDGFIDFYNKGWFDYTGTNFESMQGWGWESVHDPAMLPEVVQNWKLSIKTGNPFEMKFPLKGQDGVFRWFLTRVNPIRDQSGKLIRWVGINTNIQEEIDQADKLASLVAERTAALEIAKDLAERALEAKERFLATVSHEVRTPMSGIIGVVELMHFAAKDEEMQKLAKLALDSSQRLLHILNDLLDASKLQAGAIILENRTFAVRPILGDIMQLVGPEASKKGILVTCVVGSDVPETVCGDELRLRQILQNLAFNAVKFTSEGTAELKVEYVEKFDSTTVLRFSVTDTGIGISDEQKEKLFQPFAQADDSTARLYAGTGLGLHICRTLTELMGGELGVESQPNEGSTFWVVIPFRDELCHQE